MFVEEDGKDCNITENFQDGIVDEGEGRTEAEVEVAENEGDVSDFSDSDDDAANAKSNKFNNDASSSVDPSIDSLSSRSTTSHSYPHEPPGKHGVPLNVAVGDDDSKWCVMKSSSVTVAYVTTTGTCKALAQGVYNDLRSKLDADEVRIVNATKIDWWDQLLNPPNDRSSKYDCPVVILLIPTWSGGSFTDDGNVVMEGMKEIVTDWRVEKRHLSRKLKYAVYGVGSSAYDDGTFCKPAKEIDKVLEEMGATRIAAVGKGDVEAGDIEMEFKGWSGKVAGKIFKGKELRESGVTSSRRRKRRGKEKRVESCGCKDEGGEKSEEEEGRGSVCERKGDGGGCCQQQQQQHANEPEEGAVVGLAGGRVEVILEGDENDEEGEESDGESAIDTDDDEYDGEPSQGAEEEDADRASASGPTVEDLEDMGRIMMSSRKKNSKTTEAEAEPKEMVTPKQAQALKKEGYKLIKSHSAVKLCRWTKHQLRGRGGCYKHSFYGITSYQCMEATPSLACANKCTFCWRHHKNPVGRKWRWKVDDPYDIVQSAVDEHVKMIKGTRGIPGVKMDRWSDAHDVRHCALSLVGEPIMYPRINELLQELHRRRISTFLVTNGQHPDAIATLVPVTQLYVSVDAATPETLDAIDRPLFKDAFQRLKRSLKMLRDRGQRTVARLTIVKGWNSDEIDDYASLIALGRVSFVELKGVTFCGTSDASNLNISNSPWHHEVVEFAEKLRDRLKVLTDRGGRDPPPLYDISCEHRHSCSVLLARVDTFAVASPDGSRSWNTWIDYEKFHELAVREKEGGEKFTVSDYAALCPKWAEFGAAEEGFDPTETRVRRKGKRPKYTKFDSDGVPTHDSEGDKLIPSERQVLLKKMSAAVSSFKRRHGSAGGDDGMSVVTESKRGTTRERVVTDPRLMFRGLVVA